MTHGVDEILETRCSEKSFGTTLGHLRRHIPARTTGLCGSGSHPWCRCRTTLFPGAAA